MSHPINTLMLESAREDCEQFISEWNWKDAQAIIDNLFETGFESEGMWLKKKLMAEQYEATKEDRQLDEFEKTGKYQDVRDSNIGYD